MAEFRERLSVRANSVEQAAYADVRVLRSRMMMFNVLRA